MEQCNFCQDIVNTLLESNKDRPTRDMYRVAVESLEAFGKKMDCGKSKLVCLPLIRANQELRKSGGYNK